MANEIAPIAGANDLALLNDLRELFEGFHSEDLAGGIQQSYPIISIKGKVWRVKHKGEEKMILDPTTRDPVPSLHAIIVKSSPHIAKLYYAKGYQEGDDTKPDCFSLDGLAPDPSVQNPPCGDHRSCAICPKNAWGSKITEAGEKRKACADQKRVAVVPASDPTNEGNGPMLLRVPAASLQNLATLGNKLAAMKVPYQAVVVKMSFDVEQAYPRLVFTPTRAIDKETALIIKKYLDDGVIDRMLDQPAAHEAEELATQAPPKINPINPVKPAAKAKEPESTPESTPDPERPTTKQTAMDEGETVSQEESSALDAMLADILG